MVESVFSSSLNVPYLWVIASFVALCVVDVFVLSTKRDLLSIKHTLVWSLLIEFIFLTYCSTVFCRDPYTIYEYELIPFWSYQAYFNGRHYLLAEILLNIILFIPIGFLLSGVIGGKRWAKVLIISFCISLSVELMQLMFKRGLCEVDDLIHNTLGTLIGFWCYFACVKFIRTKYVDVR